MLRSVPTRSAVCALSGEVVGNTLICATAPLGLVCGGQHRLDARASCSIAARDVGEDRVVAADGSGTTTSSGPLVPGPKPCGDEVVGLALRGGRREVAVVGLAQAHGQHRRRDDQQDDDVPRIANGHAWSATSVAQRSQTVAGGRLGALPSRTARSGWWMRLGTFQRSMPWPTTPMTAGSRVSAASIITATTSPDM